MATANADKKWERCLEIIKCNVKEQEYQTWFQPVEFVAFDTEAKELTLRVPTNFFFEMLDGQFKPLMYNVVWRVFSKGVSIIYRIQTDSNSDIDIELEGPSDGVRQQRMSKDKVFKQPVRRPAEDDLDSQLNPDYRFENFIEGESNKLPRSVGKIDLQPTIHLRQFGRRKDASRECHRTAGKGVAPREARALRHGPPVYGAIYRQPARQ